MNKKLLALAVTSALAGVSAEVNADTANVNVYGKIYVQYQTISGNNLVSRREVDDPNSYIGFKGEDNLGGGMKGWFQIEQTVQADDAGARVPGQSDSSATNSTDGKWSTRNSAVGLSGGFGNVFLGRWDTVYKQLGDPVSFLGISSGNFVSTSNVLSKRYDGKGAGSFHLRQSNYVEYDTPTLGGLTAMLGYSPDEAKDPVTNTNKRLQSAGIKFEQGPLYVALGNEVHKDFFVAAGQHSNDMATRLSAKYALPTGTTLGVDVSELKYKSGATNTELKSKTLSLVVTQAVGNVTVAGGVVKAFKTKLDGSDVADSDAQQINLGVGYNLSKRTQVYAIYAKLTNKAGAQYNNLIDGSAVTNGVDPEQAALGIAVSF
jgi:predicted porin